MFDLTNRTAIVTGGAAGIGKGIVACLREAGASIVIADIDADKAEATAAELGATAYPVDVTDRALHQRNVCQGPRRARGDRHRLLQCRGLSQLPAGRDDR